MQSRCSPDLLSPSHNNLWERKEHVYGGWVKNKGARCHPLPGMGRVGQEPTSGCAAWLPGKRVPSCREGQDRRATAAGDRRTQPTGAVGTATPAQGAPCFPGGGWCNSTVERSHALGSSTAVSKRFSGYYGKRNPAKESCWVLFYWAETAEMRASCSRVCAQVAAAAADGGAAVAAPWRWGLSISPGASILFSLHFSCKRSKSDLDKAVYDRHSSVGQGAHPSEQEHLPDSC